MINETIGKDPRERILILGDMKMRTTEKVGE